VILDGSLVWLPSNLAAPLRQFAQAGGDVLSVGIGSLQAQAPITRSASGLVAGPPSALRPDPFGAQHGRPAGTQGQLITVLTDPLSIFGSSIAFPGFKSYQPITPPDGGVASIAGVAPTVPAVTGFRTGSGTVVEVGLPGFGASLAHDVDSQELLRSVWHLLSS
jgi:hypothetical protein